ncbi:hypothetical protein SAMN02745126_03949 [Enhydrobacter aerosaccus]|uniref:Uncharacterized protein n=1 Tax=Enhydrobacter aerosaccus TaxID=225324 RepID=A0A1T4RMG7_9HYPH|nr:hypothetical protein [Enhydrobacter aerosaccus]SKA17087.1 hypothetical protein SAMN02745126_03949 [Enhydrobacter aerosaccus]
MDLSLEIEPTGSNELASCPWCGQRSRTVWGHVYADDLPRAAYFFHWTVDRIADRGASINVIIGDWGDGTTAEDRMVVALEYRRLETGPGMGVVDTTTQGKSRPATRALRREEVIGTALADEVFAIVDTCLGSDSRLAELL